MKDTGNTTIQPFETTTLEQPKVRSNEQFTPEQINAFCKPIEGLCNAAGWVGDDIETAVQIIRQLQARTAHNQGKDNER